MKSDNKKGKKIKKLRSLNGALWLYFCLLLVLLIVLVELVFSIVMTQSLENRARADVEQVCQDVAGTVEISGRDTDTTLNITVLTYFRDGTPVWVYNDRGDLVAPSVNIGDMFSPDDAEAQFAELQSRLDGYQSGISVVYRSGTDLNGAVMATNSVGAKYYIAVTYSMVGLRNMISTTMLYLLVVGICVLILGLMVAYVITQKFTRGVKDLSDSATKLAKGDYTAKFTNADYQELADLSDTLNEMRDEVKKSSDFQREILANVTHDLKTPITMIKAYASMIQDFSGDDPVRRNKHLQVIIDESDRLTGLINDVLDVSKVTSNLDTLNPKVFNLTEFLYGIINKFSYLQDTQGYNLMVDIDPDQYTRADMEKIGQVIYNLLGNAANYTGEDKTVYISLKASLDGERIKFSVRDTGKGISKEELPNIWDRYYRSKKDHVRPVKGTGLGLNICKIILTNHKFDFGVDSELGKGSTFWVDFPAVRAETIEEAEHEDAIEAKNEAAGAAAAAGTAIPQTATSGMGAAGLPAGAGVQTGAQTGAQTGSQTASQPAVTGMHHYTEPGTATADTRSSSGTPDNVSASGAETASNDVKKAVRSRSRTSGTGTGTKTGTSTGTRKRSTAARSGTEDNTESGTNSSTEDTESGSNSSTESGAKSGAKSDT